jgi:hypothetical protein
VREVRSLASTHRSCACICDLRSMLHVFQAAIPPKTQADAHQYEISAMSRRCRERKTLEAFHVTSIFQATSLLDTHIAYTLALSMSRVRPRCIVSCMGVHRLFSCRPRKLEEITKLALLRRVCAPLRGVCELCPRTQVLCAGEPRASEGNLDGAPCNTSIRCRRYAGV